MSFGQMGLRLFWRKTNPICNASFELQHIYLLNKKLPKFCVALRKFFVSIELQPSLSPNIGYAERGGGTEPFFSCGARSPDEGDDGEDEGHHLEEESE